MIVKIETSCNKEPLGHLCGSSHHCDISNSIRDEVDKLSEFINKTIKVELTNDGAMEIRDSLWLKTLSYENNNTVIETEYLAVAVICTSYLKHLGLDYSIELQVEFDYVRKIEELVEIYHVIMPSHMVCKKVYGIENEESCSAVSTLEFKFGNTLLQEKYFTAEMLEDALEKCRLYYSSNLSAKPDINQTIIKQDMKSIKFTKLGLRIISRALINHKKLFNTPYENVDKALEYWGLIE